MHHTHTHTHTHTCMHARTQRKERERESKSNTNQAFQKVWVEGYGLTAYWNVLVIVTLPTWTSSEFQTDGPE